MDLIQTKLTPPLELKKLLARPRLEFFLQKVSSVKLTLIQAPAGYGKTSLLAQWYKALEDRGQQAGWISIDAFDYDPFNTLMYVAGALERASHDFAEISSKIRRNEGFLTPALALQTFVNALSQHRKPVFLFIDDIHLADRAVVATLQRLIEQAPTGIHFIVATRVAPDFPLFQMRIRGELLELGINELTFTADEARQFLWDAGHSHLQQKEAEAFASRTEGWITGLKLASLAWPRHMSAQEFLSSFAGTRRSVADFFAEEIFTAQPAAVQKFLLSTSILERFTRSLCNAVCQDRNAEKILDQIETSNLFLLKLDEDGVWYRYHHLFAQFLRRQLRDLSPKDEHILYARASEWYYDNHFYIEAIEYSIKANDFDRAAKILSEQSQDLAFSGRIRLVAKLAKQIPLDVLQRHPIVLLTLAWLETYRLRFEESNNLLSIVRAHLHKLEEKAEPSLVRQVHGLLLHQEICLAVAQDNAENAESLCQKLLSNFDNDIHPYLKATAYTFLIFAQREQHKFSNLFPLFEKAKVASIESGYPLSQVVYQATAGSSLFLAGKADAARHVLEDGLAKANRELGPGSALAALPALPLCEVLYELNELDKAQELLAEALPAADVLGFADQIISGYITQSRIHAARGDLDEAYAVLDTPMAIAIDRDLERLRMALVAERVRLLLQHSGNINQAVSYAENAGIPASPELVLPTGRTRPITEAQAITWVRINQRQDRVSDALRVAKQWSGFAAARGAIVSLVRWNIQLAQIHLIGGDTRTAQQTLRKAIDSAAPSQLIRSFLDEGPIIKSLLESLAEAERTSSHPIGRFMEELLNALAPETSTPISVTIDLPLAEGLYGKLTTKEVEILSLVGSGMRNAEIATKLGMTEGSIKWYLQQIYDKLGTRRRLQAVERARQLGLLP